VTGPTPEQLAVLNRAADRAALVMGRGPLPDVRLLVGIELPEDVEAMTQELVCQAFYTYGEARCPR
jgi:hypothetical protein